MGANSKIEWTDHTFNPWIGCSKVHAGCTHCYAESLSKRTGKAVWGPNGTRVKTSDANWKLPVKWNRDAESAGERRRVFCASLADVFEDWQHDVLDHKGRVIIPNDEDPSCPATTVSLDDLRRELFQLIDATPMLDWLLLTKRPENIARMWPMPRLSQTDGYMAVIRGSSIEHRKNVWLGTSVSDQATADKMVPELLKCGDLCPALFLSAEPLLGPIDLCRHIEIRMGGLGEPDDVNLQWVIVGGESGHGARPMHPDWARGLRDQCQAADVPFFFKQWGEWAPETMLATGTDCRCRWIDRNGAEYSMGDSDCQQPATMRRVGKKAAGRLLDGREWSEFPEAAVAAGSSQ